MATLRRLWYALAGLTLIGLAVEQVLPYILAPLLGAAIVDLDTGEPILIVPSVANVFMSGALVTFSARIGWALLVRSGCVVPFRKGGRRFYGSIADPLPRRVGLDRYLHPGVRCAPRSWPVNARAYLRGGRR